MSLKLNNLVVYIILLLCIAACTKQNYKKTENGHNDLNYPINSLNDFWSTPMIVGKNSRSIGFYDSGGLYVLWERIEGMPMTQLHNSYNYYRHINNKIYLNNSFCESFILEIKKIDGVAVMLPQGVSAEEALRSNWFLIHREGASSKQPFSFNKLTKFDIGK